jgi:hypothetical protein
MIELARATEVLQWGFDETSIDGTPTLNQWVLVPNGTFAPRVITIQGAGIANQKPRVIIIRQFDARKTRVDGDN